MTLICLIPEELLNLHRGQGLELFWRDSLTCPTEEEYVQMVNGSQCSLVSNPELCLNHPFRDRRPTPDWDQTDDELKCIRRVCRWSPSAL